MTIEDFDGKLFLDEALAQISAASQVEDFVQTVDNIVGSAGTLTKLIELNPIASLDQSEQNSDNLYVISQKINDKITEIIESKFSDKKDDLISSVHNHAYRISYSARDNEIKNWELYIGKSYPHGIVSEIFNVKTLDDLNNIKVRLLGKNGSLKNKFVSKDSTSSAKFAMLNRIANAAITAASTTIQQKYESLVQEDLLRRLATERVDMTLPAPPLPQGSVHPVSQVMDELAEIFADMGFAVAEGPEIEDQWHNFTALNMPDTHPARAMHDTFYLQGVEGEEPKVLRTHTSPVQIRTMMSQEPPIRIIAPGRVYRSDSDATHTPMFHQIEGLVIDKGIHLGHLKWTLETFLKAFFERDDLTIRLRPSYFPFTEPSAEVDVSFSIENGKRILGGSGGWMELLGSGMVHPKVIAACGLDPEVYQGFAFGVGVDRLAMLKYGMDDLRAFFDGDLRWLKHYGFGALDVPTLSAGVGA